MHNPRHPHPPHPHQPPTPPRSGGESGISFLFAGIAQNSGSPEAQAGDIILNATDTISVSQGSAIANQVLQTGIGNAGGINITTNNLALTQGGFISASTFGQGNSGGIEINTNNLSLTQGGFIDTSTFGKGNAGAITIKADGTISSNNSRISSSVAESGVGNSGGIEITTNNLSLTQGGRVETSTFGQGNAGNLIVRSSEVEVMGTIPDGLIPSGLFIATQSAGAAGNITIDTGKLIIQDGGQVVTLTSGKGKAGNVTVTASESVELRGNAPDSRFPSILGAQVTKEGEGNAGDMTIETGRLSIRDGTQVNNSTFGVGDAGNLIIRASEVEVIGESADGKFDSGIHAQVEIGAEGNAKDILIEAGRLILKDGGQVSAIVNGKGNGGLIDITAKDSIIIDGETPENSPSAVVSAVNLNGVGNAGEVNITTGSLSLTNGGRVSATALGQGNGGDVTINATESIFISGFTERFRSGISVDALINDGNSGNANIFTNKLTIENGGTIEASNFDSLGVFSSGTGEPGNIVIEANSISLANGGRIDAATQSETGNNANINLRVADNITLRDNSFISAQAFNNANGGNIDINTKFIVAFPNQNNDIIANAFEGKGGNINITAEGIFGLEERSSTPPNETNDIDASSDFGLDGSISIDTPTVDPTSGLVELTQEVVDASQLIAQNVCTQTANSEFVDIGKGGLPQNPDDVLAEDMSDVGLVAPVTASEAEIESNREIETVKPKITRKPPAQGWIWHEDDSVELVAYNPNQLGEQRTWDSKRGCQ